jgi:glycosyltransferase involved in cell wall biosynthesis
MKVVFSLPHAERLVDPTSKRVFGGAEVRGYTFARGLCKAGGTGGPGEPGGFDVMFQVGTEGATTQFRLGGLTVLLESGLPADIPRLLRPLIGDVFTRVRRTKKFPWLQVRGWKLAFLWQLPIAVAFTICKKIGDKISPPPRLRAHYMRPDADVFCAFGTSNNTAELVAACKKRNIPSVVFIASDSDLSEQHRPNVADIDAYGQSSALCYYAIVNADQLIVQSDAQKQILKTRFNRDSALIKNPVGPCEQRERPAGLLGRYVFWVGRADAIKRPGLAFELASRCPDLPFVMVLNRVNSVDFDRAVATKPANVRVIERLPPEEIEAYYQHAAVFLNTSAFEGFPNTFLQAGKYGVPVFSLEVDPDAMLESHGCGFWARGDLDKLADALRAAWREPPRAMSENIRRYVAQNHELSGRVAELAALLQALPKKG